MLVVLTSEREIDNEAAVLNRLFESGLKVLHLRKPSFQSIDDYKALLDKVDTAFHERIVVHFFHELCENYQLRGVHIQEQPRINLGENLDSYVNDYHSKGFSVSSSFHEPEVLADCPVEFDYHFLSPVFSSISKQGYEGRGFNVNDIDKKIIGMGGINNETISKTFELGFKGIGVLGGVWNTESPIDSFKTMKAQYDLDSVLTE